MANIPTDPIIYKKVVEKIKASVNRWPSAYASGMVVKDYKRIMALIGREPYKNTSNSQKNQINPLTRWFQEKWIDIATGKPCGRKNVENTNYPTCRPSVKISKETPILATELTAIQKKQLIKNKQKAQKNKISFPKKD
jgi:hypothetical protein